MKVVHEQGLEQGGSYHDACPECISQYEQNHQGCLLHHPRIHRIRQGNPVTHASVQNTKKFLTDNSLHTVNGAKQVTPGEVRRLGSYCIAQNSWYHFAIFVLFLMSIELFLRRDEYRLAGGEAYQKNMCVMTGNFLVEAIALKLKVKKTRDNSRTATQGKPMPPDLSLSKSPFSPRRFHLRPCHSNCCQIHVHVW